MKMVLFETIRVFWVTKSFKSAESKLQRFDASNSSHTHLTGGTYPCGFQIPPTVEKWARVMALYCTLYTNAIPSKNVMILLVTDSILGHISRYLSRNKALVRPTRSWSHESHRTVYRAVCQ